MNSIIPSINKKIPHINKKLEINYNYIYQKLYYILKPNYIRFTLAIYS